MRAKIVIAVFLLVIAVGLTLWLIPEKNKEGDRTADLIDLGIPLEERYTNDTKNEIRARCSEDMIVYEGQVYVGGGDYDTNMGPVGVYSYDLADGGWRLWDGVLEDEQIKRFLVLDGTLCIPGTDPRGDWSVGNYYVLSDGDWQERRVLPSGIHCYDGVIYDGTTFFGLGVNGGDFPVVASKEGEAFFPVPFVRGGEKVDTSDFEYVRVYNFVIFDGALYAFFALGNTDDIDYCVYRYDGEVFSYVSTPSEIFLRNYDIAHTGEFGGLGTFINGYCYYTSQDMTSFRPCRVGDSDLACDMEQIGGKLYVLAHRMMENGEYETGVYVTEDGLSFQKLFCFYYEVPANSFAYSDGMFYFSMGRYYDSFSKEMGRVLALKYQIR